MFICSKIDGVKDSNRSVHLNRRKTMNFSFSFLFKYFVIDLLSIQSAFFSVINKVVTFLQNVFCSKHMA